MLILFDHSTPAPLRAYLKEHTVTEARDRGWDRLSNGDLLNAAEAAGFEVSITADKNIRYQQNLTGRRLAIVELGTPRWRACFGMSKESSQRWAPQRRAAIPWLKSLSTSDL